MNQTKKPGQVIAQIMIDLNSEKEDIVLKAIKKVRSKGNEQIIPSLFNTYRTTKTNRIKDEITNILSELKSTATIEPLIEELNIGNEASRCLALTAIWSSGLNANEHIDEIIQTAINGSFLEAFEALTIIENLDPPFEEEVILNSQLILKTYFGNHEKSEKSEVLRNITAIINGINSNLQ
ncbi:MAG: hypothetical protein HON99_06915 [Crocinitomicaceae bacterium]|nr:hypothetical protein [Crocinitomicaceae bacterium]